MKFINPKTIAISISGALLIAGVSILGANQADATDYDGVFADNIAIPEVTSAQAMARGNYSIHGLGIDKSEFDGNTYLLAREYVIEMEFDNDNKDFEEEMGSVVKVNVLETSANGADEVYGIGFLKNDSLTVYYADVIFLGTPESIDELKVMNPLYYYDGYAVGLNYFLLLGNDIKPMLKAYVGNLAHFSGKFYDLYPENSEGFDIECIDDLAYKRIIDATPKNIFRAANGATAEIQLLPPPRPNIYEVKAIASGTASETGEITGVFCTPIDKNNEFMLGGEWNGTYIGRATWMKDRLQIHEGQNNFDMPLVQRNAASH